MTVTRGRLLTGADAPATGERSEEIVCFGGVLVEQIVSGALPSAMDFDQDHDEWVVVLSGHAVLFVEDERVELECGDWVLLPAHALHRLVETQPGTRWLAVRLRT